MIIVDDREPRSILAEIKKIGQQLNVDVLVTRREFGDYLILPESAPTASSTQKVVGIERKTVSDFYSSFTKHRLQDQLHGLRQRCDVPYLLLEGTVSFKRQADGRSYLVVGGRTTKFLKLSFDLYLFYLHFANIGVIRQPSTEASLAFLFKLHDSLSKERRETEFLLQPKEKTYSPPVQALCAVPGIGPVAAKALLHKFTTITRLLSASDGEISTISGIGVKTILNLRATFGARTDPAQSQAHLTIFPTHTPSPTTNGRDPECALSARSSSTLSPSSPGPGRNGSPSPA